MIHDQYLPCEVTEHLNGSLTVKILVEGNPIVKISANDKDAFLEDCLPKNFFTVSDISSCDMMYLANAK